MNTCQCEGLQIGQSNGVLLKEVSAFQWCLLIEVSLYSLINCFNNSKMMKDG